MVSELSMNAPDFAERDRLRERLCRFPAVLHTVIGESLLSRPIDLFRIGAGEYRILLVAAHHAMEHITALLLYDFAFSLVFRIKKEDFFAKCLQKFSFFIVPALNPDGIELLLHPDRQEKNPLFPRALRLNGGSDFSAWQANARGVDLNHNYAAGFWEYKAIERARGITAGRTRFSGEYPESEPETAALAALTRAVGFSAVVSLQIGRAHV